MNSLQLTFGITGTILGVAYAILGLMSIKHLKDGDATDKYVGWSLWWFLDSKRYSQPGKILCKYGAYVGAAATLCWLLVYIL